MTLIADIFPKLRTQKNLVRSMPKKSRFKGSFEKQHGKCAQILLKCQGQLLYHIYWSLLRQLSYKKSLLVICKISRLFINTLSADGKCSLLNRDNLTQTIQIELSPKQKTFCEFFSALLKGSWNFEHFRKKGRLSYLRYFRNYRLRKTWLHQCLKSPIWRDLSESNMVNASQTLLKFAWQHLYHIYWLLCRQLTFKKSLLVIWKISRLFPNTLNSEGKHSLLNRDNLTQPIQMQVSRKQKSFSDFFAAFLKSNLNSEPFQKKKDEPHSWCIFEITEPEKPA